MRQFDFYEFAAVIVPGTTLLFGVTMCVPAVKDAVFDQGLTVGEATLSLIVAYGMGHLVQAAGNLIETALWSLRGGWPTDWPRSGQHHLLSDAQVAELDRRVANALNVDIPPGFQELSKQHWFPIVRQIHAAVSGCDRAQGVNIFNGNYGLNRGLAAALLAIIVLAFLTDGWAASKAAIVLAVGAAVAVYRMHRFGVHYARELFVQFLSIPLDTKESHQNE